MNKIKKIRSLIGMTRREFAAAIKKTESAISNYENDLRTPDFKTAYQIINLAKAHGYQKKLEDIYPPNETITNTH